MKRLLRIVILIGVVFCVGTLIAQEHSAAPQQPGESTAAKPSEQASPAVEGKAAEGKKEAEGEEEEENANLKHSASVKWIAHKAGVSEGVAYWVFVLFNFAVLAGAIGWFAKSSLPTMFRNRTAAIQKGIEEARKASAEASARLSDIEARLARLGDEVAVIRAAAEADFTAEEQRIKQSAEEDARAVVEGAQQEIAVAARSAQRDLKTFVADLAVNLAEKKIKIDSATDEKLMNGFVTQLGKEGK